MSLPHVLLIDDSDAILAYEQAALSGRYLTSTASNGTEGLARARELRPAAILLDLSMPEMSGDELLRQLKADPRLSHIPVLIISAERARAEECLRHGAAACLVKPIKAEDLRALVARTLDQAQRDERLGGLAILPIKAGPLELAVPIEHIDAVVPQPLTSPLPLGPSYLSEMFVYRGDPVCVLDVPRRLGVDHSSPPLERMLVLILLEQARIALCVDDVHDPHEVSAESIIWQEMLGGATHGALSEALVAMARLGNQSVPVIDPRAFFSRELLRSLPGAIRQAGRRELGP